MKIGPLPKVLQGWGMVASIDMTLKGVGFLLMPIYARYMLPEDFGVFSYVSMVSSVASGVFGLGQYAIFTRSESETQNQRDTVVRGVLANIILGTIAWWLALILIGVFFRSLLFSGPVSWIVWLVLAVQPIISIYSQLLSIDLFLTRRYFMGSMRALAEAVLSHGLGISSVIYFASRSSDYRLLSCLVSGCVVLALFLPLTRFWKIWTSMITRPQSVRMNWQGFWEGLPLSLNGLVGLASNNGDRYLLEKFASKQQLGIFSFAGNLTNIISIAFSSFNNIWLGVFYQRAKTQEWRIKKTLYVGLGWIAISALSVAFFEIVFIVLKTWLSKYHDAKALIPLLGIAACFQVLTHLIVNFFNLWKKNKFTTPINMLIGAFSICIGWILIPRFGALGAAIQAAASAIVGFLMTLTVCLCLGKNINKGRRDV